MTSDKPIRVPQFLTDNLAKMVDQTRSEFHVVSTMVLRSPNFYETLVPWLSMLYFIHNIVKLHRAPRLWLVALYKSLTMIMTSFLGVINVLI